MTRRASGSHSPLPSRALDELSGRVRLDRIPCLPCVHPRASSAARHSGHRSRRRRRYMRLVTRHVTWGRDMRTLRLRACLAAPEL